MSQPLRLLHLSDFHFSARQEWDSAPVLDRLAEAVAAMVAAGQPPDVVAITGDIAFAGKAADYLLAETWLVEKLLPALGGLPRERVLLVPGNHDLDQSLISTAANYVKPALLKNRDQNAIQQIWAGADKALFQQPQQAWLDFLDRFYGEEQAAVWWARKFVISGWQVGFAALNSAWMSGPGSDQGQLLLGRCQINQTLGALRGCQLTVALLHHPKSYLAEFDGEDAWFQLRQNCQLILRGHQHKAVVEVVRSELDDCVEVASAACYQSSEHSNGFQLLEIHMHSAELAIYPYHWHQQRWQREHNQYPNSHGVGRFPLGTVAEGTRNLHRRGNPFQPQR